MEPKINRRKSSTKSSEAGDQDILYFKVEGYETAEFYLSKNQQVDSVQDLREYVKAKYSNALKDFDASDLRVINFRNGLAYHGVTRIKELSGSSFADPYLVQWPRSTSLNLLSIIRNVFSYSAQLAITGMSSLSSPPSSETHYSRSNKSPSPDRLQTRRSSSSSQSSKGSISSDRKNGGRGDGLRLRRRC